jgi:hypothetical protein
MNATDIIVEVVISLVCLIVAFGIVALCWLWVSEIKYQWRLHQDRKVRSRRSTRR